MKPSLEELKQQILARYKTVHAFCRDNQEAVKRSVAYQVLAGKYPGDTGKQIERIQAALAGAEVIPARRPELTAQEAYAVLQESKCAHCRKLDKRACPECRTQTEREAQALENYLLMRTITERS